MITRRSLLAAASAAALSACAKPAPPPPPPAPPPPPMPAHYGAILTEPFPVPAVPDGVVDPKLWRTEVANPFPFEKPGTLIVDPDAAYLHLITSHDRALRYGVSVGAAGYGWNGDAVMQFRRKWPVWKAPDFGNGGVSVKAFSACDICRWVCGLRQLFTLSHPAFTCAFA